MNALKLSCGTTKQTEVNIVTASLKLLIHALMTCGENIK
jgi:hypothetical protein